MSIQLTSRVSSLEAEVKELRALLASMVAPDVPPVVKPANPNGPRKMCPKCGVKLAYFLHTKHCKGPWQG